MFKTVRVVLPLIIFCGIVLMACQKQDVVTPPQTHTNTVQAARTTKDYTIPLTTAAEYAGRYRALVNGKANEPIAYKVPVDGLRDLINRVDANGLTDEVAHITLYMGVKDDGSRTAIYVATDKAGKDVLEFPKEEQINGPTKSPVSDLVTELTGTNITTFNILNSK